MIRRPSRSTLFPYTTFFFNNTATTEIYPLSLHDALPISFACTVNEPQVVANNGYHTGEFPPGHHDLDEARDRKSTRLNSSHANISYAVFCLKKKTELQSRPNLLCPHLL